MLFTKISKGASVALLSVSIILLLLSFCDAQMGEETMITPKEALDFAQMWIEKFKLYKKAPYDLLTEENIAPFDPLLVREERIVSNSEKRIPHYYYIIPFGYDDNQNYSRVVILIDACTGAFEEIDSLKSPIRYLTEEEAIEIALKYAELKEIPKSQAELIFKPSAQTRSRHLPLWAITIKKDKDIVFTLYIDQTRDVYEKITTLKPGS